MKATLEFNLPEDNEEFNRAVKSADYYVCLFDFYQYLRREMKYNESLSEKERNIILKVIDTFNEILINNGIEI